MGCLGHMLGLTAGVRIPGHSGNRNARSGLRKFRKIRCAHTRTSGGGRGRGSDDPEGRNAGGLASNGGGRPDDEEYAYNPYRDYDFRTKRYVQRQKRRNPLSGNEREEGPHPEKIRPWKPVSFPVYSLSTKPGSEGNAATMNILTFGTPVSVPSPLVLMLAIYPNTQTHRNLKETKRCVLQVLRKEHAPLVPLLGNTSALDEPDKLARIQEQGFELEERYGFATLKDAAAVMELEMGSLVNLTPDGDPCDHDVALFEVLDYSIFFKEGKEVLYTGDL